MAQNENNTADHPFDLVASPRYTHQNQAGIFTANEMAISHNIYIRGLNSIYQQAEGVALPKDIKDFLTFCQIWVEVINHHHEIEEEIFFPGVEKELGKEGIMAENISQHHVFEGAMKNFAQYVTSTSVVDYDGKTLKGLVDKFGKILVQHLHDEIRSLLSVQTQFDPSGEVLKKHYLLFEKDLVAKSSWVSPEFGV